MRSTAVIILLLVLFSASTSAISITERRHDTSIFDSHSPSPLEGNEVKIHYGRAIDEGPGKSIDDTTPNPAGVLEKRRGGGRGGGGGGRSSGRLSGGGSTGIGGSRSNAGGRTTTGSGTRKSYGGYYSGGAMVPYTSGKRSDTGMVPVYLSLSLVIPFFAGSWLYGSVYAYSFNHGINYHNTTTNKNETLPVTCLCQEFSVCGCDENHNQTYTDALVANATSPVNNTDGIIMSKITDVNGTRTLVINGTLENGTTADGGTDVVSGALKTLAGQGMGLFTLVAMVVAGVFFS